MNYLSFEECIVFLKVRFEHALPGPQTHKKFSPPNRIIPDISTLKDYRNSSVMLLIVNKKGTPHLLFIERADDGHVHSGQIALPGGKVEMHDKDLLATALRETKEEIGIEEKNIEVLGNLSPLYIPPSNFLVNPFAGFIKDEIKFTHDVKEVKRVLEIPLRDFFNEGVINFESEHTSHRGIVKAPCYELHGIKIWGATCMILTEFLSLFSYDMN